MYSMYTIGDLNAVIAGWVCVLKRGHGTLFKLAPGSEKLALTIIGHMNRGDYERALKALAEES